MITELLLNQFRPSIFCFATEEAKKLYPHYRTTVKDAFDEAVKKIPFQVRLIFGRGIDKNINISDLNEEYDEKIDEMLLEANLISTRSCFTQSMPNLNTSTHNDLSYSEKVEKYHKISDTIFSSLFVRTRFFPYFFLSDIPVCFLIIVAGKEDISFPHGVFPQWSLATIRKIRKTTMLLSPEAKQTSESEKQKFRTNLINTLSKWLKTTFLDQYNTEISQVESDYIREWTGFTQALANFFNARDDPKTSLVMLKAYADLKAQQGNYKEAELAYRKVCTNVKEKDDEEMLSESLFLLGCVQIIQSRDPLFFIDHTGSNNQGETNLSNLLKANSTYFNKVDLTEVISIFSSARKHALAIGKNEQAFLCGMLEFEVRKVLKAAPYRALMFIISTNIGKDNINIPNRPDVKFVTGFNTSQQISNRLNTHTIINSNTNLNISPNSNSDTNPKSNSNSNLNINSSSNLILNTKTNTPINIENLLKRRFAPINISLCLSSRSSPFNYQAKGILRIILPFLLEMMSLYSRRRKRALFLALAAHAFLIRRKRIIASNSDNSSEIQNSISDSDISDDDNFGGFLDPFFCSSMLSDAADLLQNEKWPLIRQTVSLRAISINENLVELLVNVVGSRKLLLPDQTIKITSAFTQGNLIQNSETSENSKQNSIAFENSEDPQKVINMSTSENSKQNSVVIENSEDTQKTMNLNTSENSKQNSVVIENSEDNQKTVNPNLYSNSPRASSFFLALPCGFIEAYVSDVYSHGFERCPPPSMRNNEEWFMLSERMFGSFNRGNFFSQLFRHTSSGMISASGTGGGTRNLGGTSIFSTGSSHLRCECCVGEKVVIRVALKMRNVRYDLFKFALLVNEFPLNGDGEVKSCSQSVVKSSMNVKAAKFCYIETYLTPQQPGRFEVYGVKFEWGNVTHLECPFSEQDPVIVMALPEFTAPQITLQVLPKQHLIPTQSDNQIQAARDSESNSILTPNTNTNNNTNTSDNNNNNNNNNNTAVNNANINDNNNNTNTNTSDNNTNINDNLTVVDNDVARIGLNRRLSVSSSSYSISLPSRRVLIPGQIFPLTVRITNTCGFDLSSLSMLIYTSGPVECVLIDPRSKGVFNRYSLESLRKNSSLTLEVAIHALHEAEIGKDSANVYSDEARVLLLFPFWTSPMNKNKNENEETTADLFQPVPRFDYVELELEIVGDTSKRKNDQSHSFSRSKSNNSILARLKKSQAQNEDSLKIVKKNDHPLLNFSIEKCQESQSGISIVCPSKTFPIGFSPFDNSIVQRHTKIINGRSAILNVASSVTAEKDGVVKLPSFCSPFVPKDRLAFWFSDNESVFYFYVEDELHKREKILQKKKIQEKNKNVNFFNSQSQIEKSVTNIIFDGDKNLSLLSFLGGVEVAAYFVKTDVADTNINCPKKKLKVEVKNVSGAVLNNVKVEIVQKRKEQFVKCILSGKLKNFVKKLDMNGSVSFDLYALVFDDNYQIKVAFISDEIKSLLPIDISSL